MKNASVSGSGAFSLNRLQSRDVAWMEICTRVSAIPRDFAEGIKDLACGVIAVTTTPKLGR